MKAAQWLLSITFMFASAFSHAQEVYNDVEIRVSATGGMNQILTSADGIDHSFLNGFESIGFGYELAAGIKKAYAGLSFRVGRSSNAAVSQNWINAGGSEVTSVDNLELKKFGADLNFYLDLGSSFDLEMIMGYVLNFGEDVNYKFDDISIPDLGRVHNIQSAQTRLGISGLYELTSRINLGLLTEVLTGQLNYQTDTVFGNNFFNEGAYDDPMLNWNTSIVLTYSL